jgi:7-cyano-7-deazaguanine synthase
MHSMPTFASPSRALVLFSGGQDSTACVAWALARYAHVETIGFDYGQRHAIELKQRRVVLEQLRRRYKHASLRLGDDHVLDLKAFGAISATALTSGAEIAYAKSGLPNTFVPGRNLLFLTYAAAVAYRREIDVLVGGMCETDFSGYPDCRDDTIKAMQVALSLGMGRRLTLETPLMWLDKAQTWQLTYALGGDDLVDLVIEHTHTCYLGERGVRHRWGYGCGSCPACALRANGFATFKSTYGATSASP